MLTLKHPLNQVFTEGLQLFLIGLTLVENQHHKQIACWQTIDETRQELQFKVLNELRIRKNQKPLLRCFGRFVQSLVQGQLGQNLIEPLNQFLSICRQAQVHLGVGIGFKVFVDFPGVMGQGHLVFSQNGQVQVASAQGFEHHL